MMRFQWLLRDYREGRQDGFTRKEAWHWARTLEEPDTWFERNREQLEAEAAHALAGEDDYTTGVGQVLRSVHDPALCEGRGCVIHHPSNHHMVGWPTNWRPGLSAITPWEIKPPHMERICPHGIGHPDPDDLAYLYSCGESVSISVHGCDGCCKPRVPGWQDR